MKVIGIREQERTSKSTGRSYMAVYLHCSFKDKNIEGLGVERLFCMKENCDPDIKIGDEIKVMYNRFGNVESVEKVM